MSHGVMLQKLQMPKSEFASASIHFEVHGANGRSAAGRHSFAMPVFRDQPQQALLLRTCTLAGSIQGRGRGLNFVHTTGASVMGGDPSTYYGTEAMHAFVH